MDVQEQKSEEVPVLPRGPPPRTSGRQADVKSTRRGGVNVEGHALGLDVAAETRDAGVESMNTVVFGADADAPPRRCCMCHKEYQGYGNNAKPLADGRCCDVCNENVITSRLLALFSEQ